MRLLEIHSNSELSLTKDLVGKIPPYAILSHTWGDDDEEITLQDFKNGLGPTKVGHRKIQFCADQATRDGLRYFWVDTCCIDKSNNAELSEAIVSMFRWYRNATKCYVYLADVSVNRQDLASPTFQSWGPAFRNSRWFTRGWTLQELIAPTFVEFFSVEGKLLGDKKLLEHQVHEITGITVQALRGQSLSSISAKERLSWAEGRETKREEDKAYSLLGMFNVCMPPLYGEGIENASRRLQEEIKKHDPEMETIIRQRLLQHIRFSTIRDREDRIAKALTDTFEWIYDEQVQDLGRVKWNPFALWLRSNGGLYWIAGKAGSGKSTLMKFLHSDSRIKEYLRVWAQESELVIAGHFFWNSGNSIQMSVEGSIRTLLHSIGTQLPDMLPDLFPDQWVEMESSRDPRAMLLQPWPTSECLQALRRILSAPFNDIHFFF